ncbi:hypothetical protein NE237_014308 [Protea cynaroides]|uniref:Uncharacterized protein n=1 Tax=Protea cynaroides TaxID=273540 RepID=A0A9Q0GN82_9MAGN|nr:hypothetical protein NE237_014308 [Protea cynaroides]
MGHGNSLELELSNASTSSLKAVAKAAGRPVEQRRYRMKLPNASCGGEHIEASGKKSKRCVHLHISE